MEGRTRRRLVVFARWPSPGRTKTRLVPALGPHGAVDLSRRMTEAVLATARGWCACRETELEVRLAGGAQSRWETWPGQGFHLHPQGPGDLGTRMLRAFRAAARAGSRATAIVGSDCPFLRADHLDAAFAALDGGRSVLGPAVDGGYYLVGLVEPVPELFAGVPWGTGDVLATTLRIARRLGLDPVLLPELPDIDRPSDLPLLPAALRPAIAPRSPPPCKGGTAFPDR